MANEEHLNILKQGVEVWNKWRRTNKLIRPDLIEANLREINLNGIDLVNANLDRVDLGETKLIGANLNSASLVSADLFAADLTKARLIDANLNGVNFMGADLMGAMLWRAELSDALFIRTELENTDLEEAICDGTVFAKVDLSTVKGLETITHSGLSAISIDTLFKSGGKIPNRFLRGCGVPENLIAALPILIAGYELKTVQSDAASVTVPKVKSEPSPKHITPVTPLPSAEIRDKVFISYSHLDKQWLDRLTDVLHPVRKRISIWDDTQIKPGEKWDEQIQHALASSKAAVLLVTTNFLRSDYIEGSELPPLMKAAEEEGLQILWVAISASMYKQTAIAQYQALNKPTRPIDSYRTESKRRELLVEVAEKIIQAMNSE